MYLFELASSFLPFPQETQDCIEEIYRFESERNAGEMSQIRNLPALLTKRLKALPDVN